MQTGVSVEDSIFAAYTESLKISHEILKAKQEGQQNMGTQSEWIGNLHVEAEDGNPDDGHEWQDLVG